MAISSDGTSTGNGSGSLTGSWNHTLNSGSGTNRILIIVVSSRGGSTTAISGVTYNSVAMTAGPNVYINQYGYRVLATMWYMLDSNLPASAGTYAISFTLSEYIFEWVSGGVCILGAAQAAPENTNTNTQLTGSSMSTSITSVSDQSWIVDGLAVDLNSGSGTAGGSQVLRWNLNQSGSTGMGSTLAKSGAGSATMSWTFNGTGNACAHTLASFKVLGGATADNALFFGCNM